MELAGQGNRGYAMAALLVGMSVMAVLMSALLPVWSHMATREKEEELIFRGRQYARAIGLFQRKYANTAPPTIDLLVEQRFLRKKYKDPITNDDFSRSTPTRPRYNLLVEDRPRNGLDRASRRALPRHSHCNLVSARPASARRAA
jgi:type II secretory pathway pseudopilin PulG